MSRNIALLGNGGFAKEVAEIVELRGDSVVACYGHTQNGFSVPYRGYLDELLADRDAYDGVVLAIGATNRDTLARRAEMLAWLADNELPSIPVISPHAVLSSGVTVEDGAFVGHGAIIGVDATVRADALVNIGVIIGHDALISQRAVVAPGAFIGGGACIGSDTIIGPHARILQGLSVGDDVIVGIGCTALRTLPSGATMWPQPTPVMKR